MYWMRRHTELVVKKQADPPNRAAEALHRQVYVCVFSPQQAWVELNPVNRSRLVHHPTISPLCSSVPEFCPSNDSDIISSYKFNFERS